jgi:predicted Rossmann fold nucleotide-binding protein DprA/Smf involved in DNA uptake
VSALCAALGPADVAAATLVCLPDMGPSRLRAVFERWPDPCTALAAVRDGRACDALIGRARPARAGEAGDLARSWARAARGLDLAPELARRGTTVLVEGNADYPIDDDVPDRPAVLLAEGSALEVLARPRVAIVGTRSASTTGSRTKVPGPTPGPRISSGTRIASS